MKDLLLEIASKHNLEGLCLKSFEKNFLSYQEEEPTEYNLKLGKGIISAILSSISYKIMWEKKAEFIEIKLDIMMNDNVIGDYRLIISFPEIQIIDDYFVIY